jgi:hypothetical protein
MQEKSRDWKEVNVSLYPCYDFHSKFSPIDQTSFDSNYYLASFCSIQFINPDLYTGALCCPIKAYKIDDVSM